jgi:aryl-alcohol dehydrogenase-like predicted oxidoreductase
MSNDPNRREFLHAGVSAGVLLALADAVLGQQQDDGKGLPTRPFGKTNEKVSVLCLGGWHIGQTVKESDEATSIRLMHEAIDNGLTFFDNCWDYHDGLSEEIMGKGTHDRRDKVFLMTKNCERDYQGSLKCLDESLKRLKTDHLDLWQFHEMVYDNDPDWVFDKGGIKAALEAQKAGKVRHIGFTGHKDPQIHLKMLSKPYAWASAQMPVNICDWHYRSFVREVAPVCIKQGTAVLGMKSLGGSPDGQNGKIVKAGVASAEECLRYSLSQPVASLVVGIRNQRDLDQALRVGRGFKPMAEAEMTALRERV